MGYADKSTRPLVNNFFAIQKYEIFEFELSFIYVRSKIYRAGCKTDIYIYIFNLRIMTINFNQMGTSLKTDKT